MASILKAAQKINTCVERNKNQLPLYELGSRLFDWFYIHFGDSRLHHYLIYFGAKVLPALTVTEN